MTNPNKIRIIRTNLILPMDSLPYRPTYYLAQH
jgi:hypothetical protein